MNEHNISRRTLLKALLALGISGSSLTKLLHAATQNKSVKKIPSSGEEIPVIGLGTSRTFDALGDEELLLHLKNVMQVFFDNKGALVDSSPMYGGAEAVIGKLLKQITNDNTIFSATKVWTYGQQAGVKQMEESRKLWGIKRFDLMQIHNLRDWEVHYKTLKQMKAEGQIRYIGVTTSHGRFHNELEELLETLAFDFVQLSYNIDNREVEEKLLKIALDKGVAVIVNRPYQRGDLFSLVRGKALPDWASEIDVTSWGQYFLKYIVSHPAVTCTIPATTKVKHLVDNMAAQTGRLPDAKMRNEMIRYFKSL
ncbi:MAG: aldo/keto reductase [Gammaproteobacteria bacterium]|nr:aldo/keto reductase [Gammaproteobacteria bacterium]